MTMQNNPITKSIEEYNEIIKKLTQISETSLALASSRELTKALILACASFHEHEISHLLEKIVEKKSNSSTMIKTMVKIKVIDRQYHTYFDWKQIKTTSINSFLALLGEDFSTKFKTEIKQSEELQKGITAFMEIGSIRNRLVHQNFSTFPLEKTLDEISVLFSQSQVFIKKLDEHLMH